MVGPESDKEANCRPGDFLAWTNNWPMAEPSPGKAGSMNRWLLVFALLAGPLLGVWVKVGNGWDPNGLVVPAEGSKNDAGGTWDPNGAKAGSLWDPNGLVAPAEENESDAGNMWDPNG